MVMVWCRNGPQPSVLAGKLSGVLTANSFTSSLLHPALVTNQEVLHYRLLANQLEEFSEQDLISLSTFGINDETLKPVFISTMDYLTIAGGKNPFFNPRGFLGNGKGVDGTWVFNIANYLSFAKLRPKSYLKDVTDNSSYYLNVVGDKNGRRPAMPTRCGCRARGIFC